MPKPWDALLPVALEALLLLLISRLLFVGVISAFADRRGKGLVIGFLRLPGNLVHEYSHCLGFWLCGYRVKRVLLCIFDPKGRGSCQPGRPWSLVTLPWLATGVASLLPLVVGSLALSQVSQTLGILRPAADLAANELLTGLGSQALAILHRLDWQAWQTYLFLYLTLSIGAELAPSATDLRYGLPALALAVAGMWLLFFALDHAPHLHEVEMAAQALVMSASAWLRDLWLLALILTAATAAVSLGPGVVMRALRRR